MQAAFSPADILLPGKDIDKTKWAVVACDQYTSEPITGTLWHSRWGTAPPPYS